MLFLQGFSGDNVYAGSYKWAGQSVAGSDSARFFTDRFNDLTSGASELSALTLDGVNGVWYSDLSRWNNTISQQQYDKGLSDAALSHKLPFRVDQEFPSDILASTQYGARTVARCTSDANPCPGKGPTGPWAPRPGPCLPDPRWTELVGAALLLAPVGMVRARVYRLLVAPTNLVSVSSRNVLTRIVSVCRVCCNNDVCLACVQRPFTDVMWTTSVQSADPRWGVGAKRPTVVHDLIVSTLSAGPVGFGDLVGNTDAQLLAMATRKDGNILKPAATALRIERCGKSPFLRHFVLVLPRQARDKHRKKVFSAGGISPLQSVVQRSGPRPQGRLVAQTAGATLAQTRWCSSASMRRKRMRRKTIEQARMSCGGGVFLRQMLTARHQAVRHWSWPSYGRLLLRARSCSSRRCSAPKLVPEPSTTAAATGTADSAPPRGPPPPPAAALVSQAA